MTSEGRDTARSILRNEMGMHAHAHGGNMVYHATLHWRGGDYVAALTDMGHGVYGIHVCGEQLDDDTLFELESLQPGRPMLLTDDSCDFTGGYGVFKLSDGCLVMPVGEDDLMESAALHAKAEA